MKRLALVLGLAVGLATVLPFNAHAGSFAYSPACQPGTLAGKYSFTLNGSDGSPPRVTPFASVILVNLDGSINFSGAGAQSSAGSIEQVTIDGTYKVNPDCSADFSWDTYQGGTLIDTSTASGVIDSNGTSVHILVISATQGPETVSGAFDKAGYY
jgi:hypothetical protein